MIVERKFSKLWLITWGCFSDVLYRKLVGEDTQVLLSEKKENVFAYVSLLCNFSVCKSFGRLKTSESIDACSVKYNWLYASFPVWIMSPCNNGANAATIVDCNLIISVVEVPCGNMLTGSLVITVHM